MARWSFWPRRRRRSSFTEPLIPPYLSGPRRRPKRGKDTDDGGVPVEPNRPNTLSGGAAAELEFDD